MKLVYRQVTKLNQWSWYWTDGFSYATRQFNTKDEALKYGLVNQYIDKIEMYPEYESILV